VRHRHTAAVAVALAVAPLALAAGTVSFSLSSPSHGATVAPGATLSWSISVAVSTGDNLGLALASVDLVPSPANPAGIFLTPGGVPAAMASFSRPDGISNPGPGGTGYGGTPMASAGGQSLVQIGGAQNTFGAPAAGIGLDAFVEAGVGQAAAELLSSGSFTAPTTPGTYSVTLANSIANTLSAVNAPPDFSPVTRATAVPAAASITFTVGAACPGDITGDGQVSQADLGVLLAAFNTCPGDAGYVPAAGALAGDACVTQADLGVLLANFGQSCP
jgi:hypothetical protein